MDNSHEGILLIGTTMVLLVVAAITVLAVMVIYRKRKLDHRREIEVMNIRYTRELMQAQIEVQRETMCHIGREIHDNVGQKLVLAALYAADPTTAEKIAAIGAILHESLGDLRGLSKSLTDLHHLNSDLYQLISNECTRVRMTGACPVHLDSNTTQISCRLPVKSFVLRILQEFLQNSLKHAACTEIAVRIQRKEDCLEITAADNGKGFDPALALAGGPDKALAGGPDKALAGDQGGIGLKNMRTRAEMIGASLRLTSSSPGGTKMRLTIPSNQLIV